MSSKLNRKGGAIIVPAGFLYADADKKRIELTPYMEKTVKEFTGFVQDILNQDCATLIGQKGYATNIELPSEFLGEVATQALKDLKAGRKQSERIDVTKTSEYTADNLARSFCPAYMNPPFGTRTKVTARLAGALSVKQMYFQRILRKYKLSGEEQTAFAEEFNSSLEPIKSTNSTLFPPYAFVCHSERRKISNLIGPTRIFGSQYFGEFATFTLERVTKELLQKAGMSKDMLPEELCFANHDKINVAGVYTCYPRQKAVGQRGTKGILTRIINPTVDLHLDIPTLTSESKERYKIL
jgi:hypothetical protein